jgi:hypothetical protein
MVSSLPDSLDYELWKEGGPVIASSGTTDYDTLLLKQIFATTACRTSNLIKRRSLSEHKNTNTFPSARDVWVRIRDGGSLTMASSNKTSLGQNITVLYGVPGFEEKEPPPPDYDRYLTSMDMTCVPAKQDPECVLTPEGAKSTTRQQYPWYLMGRHGL